MAPPTLLILTAVAAEAKAVAGALGIPCPGPGQPSHAAFGDRSIQLHLIGIGAKGLDQLVLDGPSDVLMVGFAGALDPALRVGDIVFDDLPPDLTPPSQSRRGVIHTSDRIVATPAEKAALFTRTGALAVDMEGTVVRQWICGRGGRYFALRVISDRADQTLDPMVLGMVDDWGRPRPSRVARVLLGKPWAISSLMRLAKDTRRAGRCLGEALAEMFIGGDDSCHARSRSR